jgi:hypothetical protein
MGWFKWSCWKPIAVEAVFRTGAVGRTVSNDIVLLDAEVEVIK